MCLIFFAIFNEKSHTNNMTFSSICLNLTDNWYCLVVESKATKSKSKYSSEKIHIKFGSNEFEHNVYSPRQEI